MTIWSCWKENDYTGRRSVVKILVDLWWVWSSSVTVLMLFLQSSPPAPYFPGGLFIRRFRAAQQTNAMLLWTLSCHPASGNLCCKSLPFLLGKSSPGLQAFAPGRALVPSKHRNGDASHFPWAWKLAEEFCRATQRPQNLLDSRLLVDSIARSPFN